MSSQLHEARFAIEAGDAALVVEVLDRVAAASSDLDGFARMLRDVRTQIDTQAALRPEGIDLPYFDASLVAERLALDDLRERTWPWDDTVRTEAANVQAHVRGLTVDIRSVLAAPTDANQTRLRDYVAQVATGSSAWLQQADMTIPSSTGPPGVAPLASPVLDLPMAMGPHGGSRMPRTFREMLLDYSAVITAIITGAAIVFLGYLSRFINNASFAGGTSAYLGLVGWAFALQVTGVTVVQIAGRFSKST